MCRGKVAEGIDFADYLARAVLVVGIPYPSFKDLQVTLKKDYNDAKKRRNVHVLSGRKWSRHVCGDRVELSLILALVGTDCKPSEPSTRPSVGAFVIGMYCTM